LLSIAAAIATIGMKTLAFALTGSVGLLSDALESLVNLAAALIALYALTVAARPADEDHAYGHTKAEYLASGFEGALILVAALSIAVASIGRLITPQPIDSLGLGAAIALGATLINFGAARVISDAGRRYGSDRKSTRLNSSHVKISYAVFCLKKKKQTPIRLSHGR